MTQTIYMLVTKDKYQLPMLVCDSAEEMARIIGKSSSAIYKAANREAKRKRVFRLNIEIDDEDINSE